MSIQTQINRINNGVAAAYSAAGSLGATLPTTQNVDNLADTVRSIPAGGIRLNFEVVGGTTQPTSPVANAIWINTDTAITSWEFSSEEPTSPTEGNVWIETGVAGQSQQAFNALEEQTMQVYPISAKQYINGTWVSKNVKQYINGAWKAWWNGELYILGNEYEDITGGWAVADIPPAGWAWNQLMGGTLTKNSDSMVFKSKLNTLMTNNPVNLTNFNTLVVEGSPTTWSTFGVRADRNNTENVSAASTSWQKGNTGGRVDISALVGEHYIVFNANNGSRAEQTITLTKVYLE